MVIEAGVELGGLCYIRQPKEKGDDDIRQRGKDRCARECNSPTHTGTIHHPPRIIPPQRSASPSVQVRPLNACPSTHPVLEPITIRSPGPARA